MTNLVSEQIPNDGGYHIKRLVNEANARLKQIGKQGRRATIVAKKTSLSLQFTFKDGNSNSQKNVGLGAIPVSKNGILEAESIARSVTKRLVASSFTWDWFNDLIGKDTSEVSKQLTCREMVEQYKEYYFKQKKDNKSPIDSWRKRCSPIEDVLGNLDKSISLALVREVVESKENNTCIRTYTINGLVEFLKYFNIVDYKENIKEYKKNNNPKPKNKEVPSDKKIIETYKTGFIPNKHGSKNHLYRLPQWQFLYGLLATYGLRIHEAWSIANWDKPVTLKSGDWVVVDTDDDNTIETERSGGDLIIPAILDPDNKDYILCIKHNTKTGYRMAMPISPEGRNWIEEFNLLQPLNLPDIENPLERIGKYKSQFKCTKATGSWLRNRRYGFTAHALRHAYTIRGHLRGYNPKALADSCGHSMEMSTTTYIRHMRDEVKYKNILEVSTNARKEYTENELLKAENEALESKLQAANNEIELLKTKLQLNQTLKESK